VHRIDSLPAGWAGKANALHTGVQLTTSPWLLFTDADTRHAPQTLRLMMGHALHQHDDFLSMFTDMKLTGPGMHLLTPTGFIILTEVAIPSEMRDPRHQGAIAVGQYILLRRAAYEKTQGYANPKMRATFADDVELAQLFKQYQQHTDIVSGRGLVFNEQWTTWRSAWQGWRKSLYSEIAPHPLIGVGATIALFTYGLVPLLALFTAFFNGSASRPVMWQRGIIGLLGGLSLACQVDSFRVLTTLYKTSRLWALATPLAWTTFGLVMLDTTRLALTGRGAGWKNRPVPNPRVYRHKAHA
jgi:chlorobactene glucosyltransferase